MSEQYPLLLEESDEDKFSARFQRRRFSGFKGRAKLQVKGAAAIMRRWPEHWSSVITYWWVGFGMIALTTFVIYNTLFTIGMVDPTNARPEKYGNYKSIPYKIEPSLPDIFMHVFVDDGDDDYNKYMPYIQIFANKYKDFLFNVIIVTNYTSEDGMSNNLDETNNNNALNSLWSSNINYDNIAPLRSNINVKHAPLSTYLDYSPLKKVWKELPMDLIPFLVRAVSVWEKGGIAINPLILTPQSPHGAYMDKLVKIIKNFKLAENVITPGLEIIPTRKSKITPRVNNIRDIINDLEKNNSDNDPYEEVLHAEESIMNIAADTELIPFRGYDKTTEKQTNLNPKHILAKIGSTEKNNSDKSTTTSSKPVDDKNESHTKLLPLFLEYLFHNKNKNSINATQAIEKRSTMRSSKNESFKNENDKNLLVKNFWSEIKFSEDYKPMIVNAKGIQNDLETSSTKTTDQDDKIFELTVDLKGNLIATRTPCHAFIGNVFMDAVHHSERDTLTDFIIKELSIFCKGLFTSCLGIDVILV